MSKKILIIGPPRSGKSVLIAKLIDYFSKNQLLTYSFLTPEIRKGNHRIGFDIEEIRTSNREKLARINKFDSDYRLGKYCVYINGLEKIISNLERYHSKEDNLLILDEIGKMEMFSKKFQSYIKRVFNSNQSIVATIGLSLKHPLKDYLLKLPGITLFNINHKNFHKTLQKILLYLQ
jgi:nucleoside-triphosphatase